MITKTSRTITIDAEIWDYLAEEAYYNGRSVSNLINYILRKEVEYEKGLATQEG